MAGHLQSLLERYPAIREAAVCSVVPVVAERCVGILETQLPGQVLRIGSAVKLPFALHYENPEAFGADRIALCAYGRERFGGQALIAVDIGTAITYDVLNSRGEYLGGMIMPGIEMMAGALSDRTAQLPLISVGRSDLLLGHSTMECINSGIFWGAVTEFEGLVERIRVYLKERHHEEMVAVIATGGNSAMLAAELREPIIVDELAVIKGCRLLLRLNRA
jgi:type III pantothenate kinase